MCARDILQFPYKLKMISTFCKHQSHIGKQLTLQRAVLLAKRADLIDHTRGFAEANAQQLMTNN